MTESYLVRWPSHNSDASNRCLVQSLRQRPLKGQVLPETARLFCYGCVYVATEAARSVDFGQPAGGLGGAISQDSIGTGTLKGEQQFKRRLARVEQSCFNACLEHGVLT